nr:EFR1 family ferrodoxin [Sedimentibacter sp.]
MNKQVNLVYFSATDRTAQVVKAVANGMGRYIKEYNITLPSNRECNITFKRNEVVIIGVPVYGGRIPEFLVEVLARMKGNKTAAILVTVYGNRNYDDALLELRDIVDKNGFIVIAGGAFIGEHTYTNRVGTNRPDQKDLQKAEEFGAHAEEKISLVEDLLNAPRLFIKGNFPYKERKIGPKCAPVTNSDCTNCGTCANNCPMGAINFDNCSDINIENCINCCSCIQKCPSSAKSFVHEHITNITDWLIDNYSETRNEPEIFI